ncbi:MAG: hypothetical protein ACREUZ_03040 [Burkholderiales bacterium]
MDRRTRARFDALAARMAEAYARVPEQEGMAEILCAVRAERAGRKVAARRSKTKA